MLAGIRDILIISTPRDVPFIRDHLGDGADFGIRLSYAEQREPKGIAEAFLIGADFCGDDPVCLILGDNIFYGADLVRVLQSAAELKKGAKVFAIKVADAQRFGVVNFDKDGKAQSLEEKPQNPTSNWAVTGIYFYDNKVRDVVQKLNPSARGELEITDVNKAYLARGELEVELLGRGTAWFDTGTFENLLNASNFVQMVEQNQGLQIAALSEVAYLMKYISRDEVLKVIKRNQNSTLSNILTGMLEE
jgi:glucose-1-phosphate thymidylyltransferase